jgi:hypothetical protein
MVRGRPTAALLVSCSLYGLVASAEPGAENADGKSQPAPPRPDAGTEARLAFEQGVKLIQKSDWAGAEPLLRRSAELLPRASSLYDLALCLFKLGRFEEAVVILEQLLSTDADPVDAKYRLYAETLHQRAMEPLAAVVFSIDPASAELRMDGTVHTGAGPSRRVLLRPGRHQVAFAAVGRRSTALELEVVAGDRLTRAVSLPEEARASAAGPAGHTAPHSSPPLTTTPSAIAHAADASPVESHEGSPLPWVLMGTGAASLIAAAVTGGLALQADNDFVKRCNTLADCDPADKKISDRAQSLALASDILLGVGLAAGAAGAAIWWVSLPSEPGKKQSGVAGITVGVRTSF